MGLIKDILSKYACHHEWEVHKEIHGFSSENLIIPELIEQVLICKKCGKIKKIKL
jgi:hypothetical protein